MTIIATRVDAIGQGFTGSGIIETVGYAKKADGGEGRYYLIDPSEYSGAPANAGPGTVECANDWYRLVAETVYIEQFGASGQGINIAATDSSRGFDNGLAINAAIAFASLNGWQDRVLQRDYFRDNKFHCSAPCHCSGMAPLELAAIVSLEDAETISLQRLAGSEAMEQPMRQTMNRPEMIEALRVRREQGVLGATIAAVYPIYLLEQPKDFAAPDEV